MRKPVRKIISSMASSKRSIRRWLLAVLFIAAQPFASLTAHAGDMLEYQVKAAFIYNFISFTQWSGNIDQTINLCVYGEDYFGKEIDKLQNKPVGPRSIQVLRVPDASQLTQCQVIFFSKSVQDSLASLIENLPDQPVLTLADTPAAISNGIVINMNLVNDKIVFEINLTTARKSGLDISSKLLQLAVKVHQ